MTSLTFSSVNKSLRRINKNLTFKKSNIDSLAREQIEIANDLCEQQLATHLSHLCAQNNLKVRKIFE